MHYTVLLPLPRISRFLGVRDQLLYTRPYPARGFHSSQGKGTSYSYCTQSLPLQHRVSFFSGKGTSYIVSLILPHRVSLFSEEGNKLHCHSPATGFHSSQGEGTRNTVFCPAIGFHSSQGKGNSYTVSLTLPQGFILPRGRDQLHYAFHYYTGFHSCQGRGPATLLFPLPLGSRFLA